jgi:hypothetical protein
MSGVLCVYCDISCVIRSTFSSFLCLILLKLFWNYQVQGDDVGVACFAKGVEKDCICYCWASKKERDHQENQILVDG